MTARGEEGKMIVGAALVANGQAAKAGDPRLSALDHPSGLAEPLAALNSAPGDPSLSAGLAAAAEVVGLRQRHPGGLSFTRSTLCPRARIRTRPGSQASSLPVDRGKQTRERCAGRRAAPFRRYGRRAGIAH
jgi:hypothetical protein